MVVPSVWLIAYWFWYFVPVAIKRFTTITPPGIKAIREELVVGIFPVVAASIGIEGIIHRVFEHKTTLAEILFLGTILRIGPDAHHQSGVHGMYGVGKSLRVGIILAVHLHISPTLWPIVPVLHNHIHRHMATAIFPQGINEVVRRDITLLRLDISEGIERQQLHLARKIAVALDDVVHPVTFDKVVVNLLGCLHLHCKTLAVRRILHGATGIEKQTVTLWRQEHRDSHLQIMLREPQGFAQEVHIVFHVCTKTIQRLSAFTREA